MRPIPPGRARSRGMSLAAPGLMSTAWLVARGTMEPAPP